MKFFKAFLFAATAIALAESGGRASAHNPNTSTGDDSWGLWQINLLGGLRSRLVKWGLTSPQQLTDPMVNAKAAYSIFSDAGGTFRDWSTYNHGSYIPFLGQAKSAANTVGDSVDSYVVAGKGLDVLRNGVTGAASDAAGAVTGAASGAANAILAGMTPIVYKALFVGLGVALVGVGLVKGTGLQNTVGKTIEVAV